MPLPLIISLMIQQDYSLCDTRLPISGRRGIRMWIQPVHVFNRFSQTFDEVEKSTRSSVQQQESKVFFLVKSALHNRLFLRHFIFIDAICLLQAALSCVEYVSCILGAIYIDLYAFSTFQFELLLSIDICGECDM